MRRDGQDGAALVFALLAVVIIGGVATVMVTTAVNATRQTGRARDVEMVIHVAEAGIDAVVASVNGDDAYTTATPAGDDHVYDLGSGATQDEERAWAVAIAEDPAQCDTIASGRGEACGIRPLDGSGVPLDVVYGVGFVPDRTDAVSVRVVKVAFDRGHYSPQKAILASGDLEISGNPEIGGIAGHVHTNADLKVSGNPSFTGELTYSGTLVQDDTGAATPVPAEPIPEITARQLYDQSALYSSLDGDGNYTGSWYDMCDDGDKGEVRAPAATPCTGQKLWDGNDSNKFRGWQFSGSGNWQLSGNNDDIDGVYYVYRGDAHVSGNPGTADDPVEMSIIAEAVTLCDGDGGLSGSVEVSGNTQLRPYLSDVLFVADRDVKISGNPSQSQGGFVGAHEQIDVSGNPTFEGALVAQDACDTLNSPVQVNKISGDMTLIHDASLSVPFTSIIRITAWNEI